MNVFYNTIVFVKDVAASRRFYEDVIGIRAVEDHGTIVFFENHFTIHDGKALLGTVFGKTPRFNRRNGKKNLEIYFETDSIEESLGRVRESGARLIHGIENQAWGQRVFRFYDPDGHIVEIGEAMHLASLMKAPEA